MKKILLCAMSCFLLVGCGNKFTCTASSDELKMKSKLTFKINGDVVTHLKEEYTFEDKETAEAFCSLMKLGKTNGELEDMKISCKSKKISISSSNVKDYYETDDLDEIKEKLEEKDFTCK